MISYVAFSIRIRTSCSECTCARTFIAANPAVPCSYKHSLHARPPAGTVGWVTTTLQCCPYSAAAYTERAAQLLDELDPGQLSRLTWALGRQVQLAEKQRKSAEVVTAATAGATTRTASAPNSKAAATHKSGATLDLEGSTACSTQPAPSQPPGGSSSAAGSCSSSPKAKKKAGSKLGKVAIDHCAELLPELLAALATSLPLMSDRSLADTAEGLLCLMPGGVPPKMPEEQVLLWS